MFNESLIQGFDSQLRVLRSDFPRMYELMGDEQLFLEAAWIKAAADLKLSGSVERIERLVLSLDDSIVTAYFRWIQATQVYERRSLRDADTG